MNFSRYYFVMDIKVAKSRVVDPDPHGSALILVAGSGSGFRRSKMTYICRTRKEFSCFEALDVFFWRAEGFSCSLCVLYGLGITKLEFFIKKI